MAKKNKNRRKDLPKFLKSEIAKKKKKNFAISKTKNKDLKWQVFCNI